MASTIRKTTSSGKLINDVPHIINDDGEYIYCKYWDPKEAPTSLVCVLHGYGEHCARYNELAERLNNIGAFVFSHDHIGHGESEGEGWYLNNYTVLVRDTLQHVESVRAKYPNLPTFIFGHSLGGCVAILAAHERPGIFRGVVVSAASILEHPNTVTPFKLFLLRSVIRLFPRFKLGSLTATWLSRDENEVKACEDDPLQVKHGVMAVTAQSYIRMSERIRSILNDIEFPFLVLHGDGDRICNVDGSKLMYEKAKSKDKTLKIYPGLYHNLEHELKEDREAHFDVILNWIKARSDNLTK